MIEVQATAIQILILIRLDMVAWWGTTSMILHHASDQTLRVYMYHRILARCGKARLSLNIKLMDPILAAASCIL